MSHPKLYETRGAHYHHETQATSFCLYAPNARNVCLILTAFGSEQHRLQMIKTNDGLWEIVTDKAPPGRTYLYFIDDYHGRHRLRTDPVSFSVIYIPEVDQIQSVVHDERAYQWGDQEWMRQRAQTNPLRSPLSIYEIQAKSWKSSTYHSLRFHQIANELAIYCREMGFTHVEMYGILEHPHQAEHGYQIANFFAPYRFSGTCDDLKYLIDHLHQNGIGVILDWIPTHFHHHHHSHLYSASLHEYDGTNMYASSPSQWGTLYFDFDKEETRRLLFASALYYLDRLHIDGIRFDAVSAMVRRNQTDIPSAISFLRDLNHTIHTYYPGVLCIAEETEGYPNLCKTMNFHLKWNTGWSYDARNLLRTPYHGRSQHWKQKVIDMMNWMRWNDDKTILTVSHDDTDSGFHNSNHILLNCVSHAPNDMMRFSDLRNFFAWQRCAPSRGHLIHMGDEIAQPMSWYQRFRRDLSSMDWSLHNSTSLHGQIQKCIRDLNFLYLRYPQFWQYGEENYSLIYEYGPNLVIAYHRGIYNNRRLAIIHNFSNRGYRCYDIPLPGSDPNVIRIKNIVEIFNTDDIQYGGSGAFQNRESQIIRKNDRDIQLRVAIPPLATIILEEYLA
jgi:1,4-alpha-glucan branching enzyme